MCWCEDPGMPRINSAVHLVAVLLVVTAFIVIDRSVAQDSTAAVWWSALALGIASSVIYFTSYRLRKYLTERASDPGAE